MIRPVLCLVAAAAIAAPLFATSAAAQSKKRAAATDGGVSVTIRKGPSYLNTRTIARPNTRASYDTSALYQSSTPTRGPGGFERWPLPSTFTLPGY